MKLKDFEMIEKVDQPGGYQAVLKYGDSLELSIITGVGAYGGIEGLYEIATIKNGEFVHMPGISGEYGVTGFLNEEYIDSIIEKLFYVTGEIPTQI